jgi:AraC family transcriptional regulator
MLCAFASKNSNTDGYKLVHIPAQTYAIFPSEAFKWEEFNKILIPLNHVSMYNI